MTRSKKPTPETVKVRLACIYSGVESFGVGEIIDVDAAEADRLVGLGVAEIVG